MPKKNLNIFSFVLIAIILVCSSCSGDKLLFNTRGSGCSFYCPSIYAKTYEELYEYSDYVYEIQIKSYKGYGESGYGCTRWDCWSFKILETFKENGKKVNEFYIRHTDLGVTFPDLSKGQEYYVFLRDYTGYDKYIPNGFISFAQDGNSNCLVIV